MYTSLIKRLIVACFVLLSSQLNSQVGGACTDLSGIDFGPCDLFLGYGLINGQCVSISGCSTVDVTSGADYAFAIYPNLSQCLPCQVEPCQDLSNLDFGPCDLELGYYWNGTQCLSISGCSTTASNGIDYANAIHPSQEACEANCGPGCLDLSGIDFGGCALVLGYYWNGTVCQALSGCSTISSQGVDYSNHIYPSPEACESECGSGCVDLSNVDFGLCLAVLGYAAGPNGCQSYSGCSHIGADGYDYSDQFYGSLVACQVACGENCIDLAGIDFGPCDAVLGFAQINGQCVEISGCSTVGNDGVDYSAWIYNSAEQCENVCSGCVDPSQIDLNFPCPEIYDPVCGCDGVTYGNSCEATYYGGVTSYTSGPCPNACTDVAGIDFGLCLAVLGWANINGDCVLISGCSTTGDDGINYSAAFHNTLGECAAACGATCLDLDGLFFGYCEAILGWAYVNGSCQIVSGCSTTADDGYNYAAWFYASEAECYAACGDDCYDPSQVDLTFPCPEIYDPVCGCDGVTYDNSCYATYYGGVQGYTSGACPGPCTDVAGVDFGLCLAILGWANVNGECVLISGCSTTGDDGINYAAAFHSSLGECLAACGGVCVDLSGVDFGPCDAILGWTSTPEGCVAISGCSLIVNGVDYSPWVFVSEADCSSECGDDCYDPNLIDPNILCPEIYDPVCGCDGNTYENSCVAQYVYGISSWTNGPCPEPCIDPNLIDPNAICPDVYDPVCGCDGLTYTNACEATYYGGVTSYIDGPCCEPCIIEENIDPDPICIALYDPVCGCDGITYSNSCYAAAAGLTSWTGGPCPCIDPDLVDPNAVCPDVWDPVCGCDGQTYGNICEAQAAGVTSWTAGECPCPNPDAINPNVLCIALYDPVCGCDGETYQNECIALNHYGITSWTDGPCPCEGEPDPDAICPDVWDPVCGCDGETYGNACEAAAAGVSTWTDGPCPCLDPDAVVDDPICPEVCDPVCGCNGLTYDNSCYASAAGILSWTDGECPCVNPDAIDFVVLCAPVDDPVCGCDGITYLNSCFAHYYAGLSSWTDGPCPCQGEPDPDAICPDVWDPVCGCDGQTYGNSCEAEAAGLSSWTDGPCPCVDPDAIVVDPICPEIYDPVCGCNGLTYENSCYAQAAGLNSWTDGPCPCPNPDLVNGNVLCVNLYDPVCGCDGVTYLNSCVAQFHHGISSWTDGECPCQGLPDPDAICPDIWDPVCGCDGITYGNACEADAAGLSSWIDGPCPNECIDPDLIDPTIVCAGTYDPVCGCDGVTYDNSCIAQYYNGVSDWTPGVCPDECIDPTLIDPNPTCTEEYVPVCGCDGISYSNDCYAQAAGVTYWTDGECPCQVAPDPNQICPAIFDPVCGCDGQTYGNACEADAAGITSWTDGPCPCPNPALVDPDAICPEIYDPVCGCDGVSYGNSCEAEAAGVYDYTPGECPCEVDPDPNQICPDVWDPVCGCDGLTYGNSCEADAAGITSWSDGECPCQGTPDPDQICPLIFDPVCGCDGQTYSNACFADKAGLASWVDGPCPCPNPDLIDPDAICPEIYDPVCGCDNVTYGNSCEAEAAGVYDYSSGECPCQVDPDPNQICPDVWDPVCGCDGLTYGNSCEADAAGITSWSDGECPCQGTPDPDQICPLIFDPVCGCDGQTYSNACFADKAGLASWIDGPCPCPNPDLIDPDAICPEIYDPVCGCDNVTYGNSCEAEAAGVYNYSSGECPCQVDPDPNQICPDVWDPVCGCDGQTYGNSCEADAAGITSWTEGECPCQGTPDPNQICPAVFDPVCGCDGQTYGNACEADAAGITSWTDGPCPEDSDGDGVPDDQDCEPNDPLVYQGGPCDDGNPNTTGDIYDDCCNCIGTPVNCDDSDPCTFDFYSEFAGCVSFDISIAAVSVNEVHFCENGVYYASLEVTVNNPDYGGFIVIGDTYFPVMSDVQIVQYTLIWDGNAPVVWRSIDDQTGVLACGVPLPVDDIIAACPADCPTDIDQNGVTNTTDLLLFLGGFGQVCD